MSTWQKTGDSVFNFPVNVTDGRRVQRERAIRTAERRGRDFFDFSSTAVGPRLSCFTPALFTSVLLSVNTSCFTSFRFKDRKCFSCEVYFSKCFIVVTEPERRSLFDSNQWKGTKVRLYWTTTVHDTCIQTTELRRIKKKNICLSVCVCFSGKNKTTRCMRGASTVATTVQTSSCVQMASLCGNEQLGERSGCIRDSCRRPKQAAGRTSRVSCCFLWRLSVLLEGCGGYKAVRTWRRRSFILKTISNTLSAVDEFDPVNLSRWLTL